MGLSELTALFYEILKLSPFVAALFVFLVKVWNTLQKKDNALLETMKEHQNTMLQIHEKSIAAQNNSAEASRDQAGAIRELKGVVTDMKEQISDKIDDLKPSRSGKIRQLPLTQSANAPVSA